MLLGSLLYASLTILITRMDLEDQRTVTRQGDSSVSYLSFADDMHWSLMQDVQLLLDATFTAVLPSLLLSLHESGSNAVPHVCLITVSLLRKSQYVV